MYICIQWVCNKYNGSVLDIGSGSVQDKVVFMDRVGL